MQSYTVIFIVCSVWEKQEKPREKLKYGGLPRFVSIYTGDDWKLDTQTQLRHFQRI